jgi:cysteinyl-tRNA synthetase
MSQPMPQLRLYNTLTRRLDAVVPSPSGAPITFYSCGPTVYDDAHIGNFRSFLNADVLRRTLELLGHRVHHVMNITDVGHMTEDSIADGGGEDKMAVAGRRIAEAKKAGTLPAGADIDPGDPRAIADFYAARFVEDACHLGLKVALEASAAQAEGSDPGAFMPRAARCVPQMIEMVRQLVDRGHAYVARDGAVYFDVRSYAAYGRLSGNTLDRLREGAGERIDAANQAMKRHPADFLLWKPDSRHLMRWPSPWGEGYPGWHIECSAMARMLLGDEIDLHSGGEDNIFPHHECEIAQSCCASGRPTFARLWFHTRHLQVEGEKMSKSKGNFFTARDLFARGVTPAALRLELIRTHYRTNANFTMQGLQDCQRMIDRWVGRYRRLASSALLRRPGGPDETRRVGPLEAALERSVVALCDDINVARVIAAVNESIGVEDRLSCPYRELTSLMSIDSVLGLLGRSNTVGYQGEGLSVVEISEIERLVGLRASARASGDWCTSDRIRDELSELGIVIRDNPQGSTWTRVTRQEGER